MTNDCIFCGKKGCREWWDWGITGWFHKKCLEKILDKAVKEFEGGWK